MNQRSQPPPLTCQYSSIRLTLWTSPFRVFHKMKIFNSSSGCSMRTWLKSIPPPWHWRQMEKSTRSASLDFILGKCGINYYYCHFDTTYLSLLAFHYHSLQPHGADLQLHNKGWQVSLGQWWRPPWCHSLATCFQLYLLVFLISVLLNPSLAVPSRAYSSGSRWPSPISSPRSLVSWVGSTLLPGPYRFTRRSWPTLSEKVSLD